MTDQLSEIRARDAADYQSLVTLKQVAESVENKELNDAIHMIEDRRILLGEVDRLRNVEALAREMIQEMRMTPDGLIVREKRDKTDAHWRLCELLWPKPHRTALDVPK